MCYQFMLTLMHLHISLHWVFVKLFLILANSSNWVTNLYLVYLDTAMRQLKGYFLWMTYEITVAAFFLAVIYAAAIGILFLFVILLFQVTYRAWFILSINKLYTIIAIVNSFIGFSWILPCNHEPLLYQLPLITEPANIDFL